MKTSKSPENTEVTPSKKKLKQARLPFKLISEVPVSPVTPQTRKRKLSAAEAESVPKVGKICKENDLVEDIVAISDDEGSLKIDTAKEEKPVNPFVKLVDTAWKKKVQKSRKKKTGKKKTILSESPAVTTDKNINDSKDEVVSMDVDLPPESEISTTCNGTSEPESKKVKESPKPSRPTRKSPRTSKSSPKALRSACKANSKADVTPDIIVLEDSNQSADASEVKTKTTSDVNDVSKTTEVASSSTEVIDKKESNSIEEINMETSKSSEKDEDEVKTVGDTNSLKKDTGSKTSKQNESPSKETKEKSPVTPKRSSRNIVKTDEKSISQSSNKLEDSISSNPVTPKHNRSLSVTTSLDDSLNESTISASNLTPKQKRLESAKKRDEREKEKQEREKKKQQEKEEREKRKQEKDEQKKKEREEKEEAKRKEKEEKEEQKRKEKEEKDRQRELEKKQKEEKEEQKKKEREEKEEQKRKEKEAREEEKRKKQEALELERQEQESKKKKAAEAFVNFFVPKQKSEKEPMSGPISNNSVLSSFTIKNDMRLAPTVRVDLTAEKKQQLDDLMEEQKAAESALYIKSLKGGSAKPLSSGKTWPLSEKDDDVMIIEDELPPIDSGGEIITCDLAVREKMRPKLLSFHDNRRPPYWGTWRKKSSAIKPRNPFGQDGKQLDYEVDSDEEWEEEQEGESLDGSAAGSDDDRDPDDDHDHDHYEVDHELFVPHGYLSDEEATMDDDDVMSLSPETQKARLKHLEDEFETEMKKPTEKLKPRLYGILWETEDGGKPEQCVDALWNYFKKLSMIMNDPTSLLQPSNEQEESEKKKVKKKKVTSEGDKQSPKSDNKKKSKTENKETKPKSELRKNTQEVKKNQPGINSFLTKMKNV